MSSLNVEDWGVIGYTKAYQRQRQLVDAVIHGDKGRLVFCQHPPVVTLGRMTSPDSLLYSKEIIQERGVEIHSIDRGGDVTLHAPGQLVVYVIMDLNLRGRNLKVFMQDLEQVAVDLLNKFGILAMSRAGQRGVFVREDKIVSIGVGVRKWVTFHGLGINVSTDLSLFQLIRPCGLNVHMSSMRKELKRDYAMEDVKEVFINTFEKQFV